MSTSSNNSEDAVNIGLRYKREGDLAHILTCTWKRLCLETHTIMGTHILSQPHTLMYALPVIV